MNVDVLDLSLLPALAFLCASASLSDIRRGLIPNRLVLYGAAWAALAYALLGATRLFDPGLTDPLLGNTLLGGSWGRLLLNWAANAAVSLMAGFVLFHFSLWSAGDAKLFFAMACLLPLKYYYAHYLPVFPSFNLFLNTITVAALYVWGENIWKLVSYASRRKDHNVWREIAGAAAAEINGASYLLLSAGVVFSLLLLLVRSLQLSQRFSATLTLLAILTLLFFGRKINAVLQEPAPRRGLLLFAGLLFAALIISPLRYEFARMAVTMTGTFLFLYLLVGVLPSMAVKYDLEGGDMPFAAWLTLGLLITIAIKGSLFYLFLF